MIVAFIGDPLSGKTMVAKQIAKTFALPYFSSGKFARENGMKLTEKSLLEQDISLELNDSIHKKVTELIEENESVVLDGFPRTLDQVRFLASFGRSYKMFYFVVNPLVMFNRMEYRGREDDVRDRVIKRCEIARDFYADIRDEFAFALQLIDGKYMASTNAEKIMGVLGADLVRQAR